MAVASVLAGGAAKAILRRVLKGAGKGVLKRIVDKGGKPVQVVVEAIADSANIERTPEAIATYAKADPESFARIVEAVEEGDAKRWAVMLAETQSGRFFVSGARPSILWACFAILIYAAVGVPTLNWLIQVLGLATGIASLPALEQPTEFIWSTLSWLLPLLYGARSVEGIFGAKREQL
ncbi:MAG: 3TM-type holin [Methyloceanibacter sp.]|nr:3TM-type holin [Methyloceanibacter sp.]